MDFPPHEPANDGRRYYQDAESAGRPKVCRSPRVEAFGAARPILSRAVVCRRWSCNASSARSSCARASLGPSSASAPARTPWGDPDLQGTYTSDNSIGVPFERPDAVRRPCRAHRRGVRRAASPRTTSKSRRTRIQLPESEFSAEDPSAINALAPLARAARESVARDVARRRSAERPPARADAGRREARGRAARAAGDARRCRRRTRTSRTTIAASARRRRARSSRHLRQRHADRAGAGRTSSSATR